MVDAHNKRQYCSHELKASEHACCICLALLSFGCPVLCQQVYGALLQFKAEHGSLNVPVAFCVPSSPPWHQDLWGLALGQRWGVWVDLPASAGYSRCTHALQSHMLRASTMTPSLN